MQVIKVLEDNITSLQTLDAIKKKLFYNKPSELLEDVNFTWNEKYSPEQIDLIHAILGIATEAGELLEALHSLVAGGNQLDIVNLKEECGDLFWYQAILANATDNTFEGIQNTVIAKLKKRFPDKFTEEDANNRDLIAEREILENE